jgi:hypothetical protein
MHHQPLPVRRALVCALALILALIVACAAAPGRAAAVPVEPTLNLQQLQTLLTAGPVSGYFLTVDQGSHIARINMTVQSIAGNSGPDGALILFQADMTDPLMQRIGNIAMGMSGSPLFVPDGGQDKLIGALSYGDMFTLSGFGLATPIEYMSAIEDKYPVSTVAARNARNATPVADRSYATKLAQPLAAGGGAVDRIVVAPSGRVAVQTAHPAGTMVFAPMDGVQIGGLPYRSRAYSALASALQKRGYTVLRGFGTGPGGWDPTFTTPLVSGAALAAMYTRGDFWAGGIGTVTYVNSQHLLAFGHPMDWIGATSLYLCNAQIDGIWGDSLASYKLGSPGAARGVITQDRGSGIAARPGLPPAEIAITSHASVTTDAARTADSTTYLTQFWADQQSGFGAMLAASAVSVPVYRASDAAALPGSATTVTTVKATDGTTHFTVRIANLWDDAADVQFATTQDVFTVLSTLEANPDGIAHATIESVDLQATVGTARRAATIGDVSVPGGLHAGANVLKVTLYVNGSTQPSTVDVPLTIPAGTSTLGVVQVTPAAQPVSSDGFSNVRSSAVRVTDPRLTLAQTVDALNSAPTNDMVAVRFMPTGSADSPSVSDTEIIGTAHTDWVVSGRFVKSASAMTLSARPAAVKKNHRVVVRGSIQGISSTATVHIYRRYLGTKTTKLVTTVTAVPGGAGALFAWRSGRQLKPAVYSASWDGDDTVLGASASVRVSLRRH